MTSTRRSFLSASFASGIVAASVHGTATPRPPRILLRSSWQTVNIGDIAHTPGVLAILETHLPQAEVRLWPSSVGNGVEEMLLRRFPKLTIVKSAEQRRAAFAECDFLLHGSGPLLVAAKDVEAWKTETRKPYGVFGITFSATDPKTLALLSGAAFVYFRDSVSLQFAESRGVTSPVMAFGPDGAFAVDLANDRTAEAYLRANGLEKGLFLCCIPRLRNTPYWKIHNRAMTAEDERKQKVNEAKKEQDHAPHRAAITAVVRQTGLKILVCPEDESQVAVGKEMLLDPLPADVKARVVCRNSYWLTDEAVSVYRRSAGLFGNEMHSPIMCIGNGIPAIVCRWAEQTSKGTMWKDIGLGDWLFDFDVPADREKLPAVVLAMAKAPGTAKEKVLAAQKIVAEGQKAMTKQLGSEFTKILKS